MKSIVWWSLWSRFRSTFFWTLGILSFVLLNMVFYPSFKNDAEELQKSFEKLPEAAVQLFGGSTDFFSPVGFLNSQIYYMMLPLLLIFLAVALGSSLLAKEEQDNTIELLLARPISRSRLLAAKAIAGILILTFVTTVTVIGVLVTAKMVELEVPSEKILEVSVVCYLMALSIGAVAFSLTALGKARRLSLGATIVIALGGYLLSSLSGTVQWLSGPSKALPFSHYQSEAILNGQYNWMHLLYFAAVIAIAALASWHSFRRRDIG